MPFARRAKSARMGLRTTPHTSASPPLSSTTQPMSRNTKVCSGQLKKGGRTTNKVTAQRRLSTSGSPTRSPTPTTTCQHDRPDDPEYLEHPDRQNNEDCDHGRVLERSRRRWRFNPHEPGYHAVGGRVQAPLPQVVRPIHEQHHAPLTLWHQDHGGVEVTRVTVVHHNGHAFELTFNPAHSIGGFSAHVGRSPMQLGCTLSREDLPAFVATPV